MMQTTVDRATATGLVNRPLADTMADTNAWWYNDAVSQERRDNHRKNSLIARKAELIQAWKATK